MKHSTFNGCARSQFTVTPGNWNTLKASIRKPWKITYRFYDPAFSENPKLWGKQFAIRGMNDYGTLKERQDMTEALLGHERRKIDQMGLNPITGVYMAPERLAVDDSLTPTTPLIRALELTIPKTETIKRVKVQLAGVVKFFGQSAEMLGKAEIPLKDVKRGDIMDILNNCGNLTKTVRDDKGQAIEVPKVWNDSQFNYFRRYIGILYSALEIAQIVEYNPVLKIPIRENLKEDEAPRLVLTSDEQKAVDEHLRQYPDFRRFTHIFHASGARETEMLRLQGKHVYLSRQRFRVLVKKGRKSAWKWKTVTDKVLPYWREAMVNCGPEDYVFSVGLVPGPKQIREDQINKRWKRLVKDKLGIKADFYSLKALYTTSIIDEMEAAEVSRKEAVDKAAEHNSHESGAMVIKFYDTKHEERKHNTAKGLGKDFGAGA